MTTLMSELGHSRLTRASIESGHVRCAAESRSKFRALAASDGTLRVVALPARDAIQALKPEPRIMRYELSDFEWTAIKPMRPNKPRGVPRINDRRVHNGIVWVCVQMPWRDLPQNYRPAPLVTIASFGGGGLASGTRSWTHWPPVMTRQCK
jgi:hypothetical protein